MKKRMLALLLTLCMVVSLLPAQMVAAEAVENLVLGQKVAVASGTSYFFTPEESGTYTLCTQMCNQIYAKRDGKYIDHGEWYRGEEGDRYYGAVWEMEAGVTYQIVLDPAEGCTMTMYKETAPTAISCNNVSISGYVGRGDGGQITYEPVYANPTRETPTYTVADPSIASCGGDMDDYHIEFLEAGKTTVTVSIGGATTQIQVESRAYEQLEVGKKLTTTAPTDKCVFQYFTAPETATYIFDIDAAMATVWDDNDDELDFWDDGSIRKFDLTEGKTYTVIAEDEPGTTVSTLITKEGAEQATAEVTILGNSKTFVLQKGDLAEGPWPSLSFDVPVGSTLGAEGYTIVFEDNETPLGWTVNGTESLATTAEVLNYPINGATTFEAGWPGAGGGDSGDEKRPNMEVHGDGGAFIVKTEYDEWETDGYGEIREAGKSLADGGVTISDPVFWDPDRAFVGWMAYTHEILTDEEGNTYEDNVQIEGTSIMTTAEMLKYPAREDGKTVIFTAQWEGDDRDYYSDVGFETLSGTLTMMYPDGSTHTTTAPGNRCAKNGSKISDQIDWTIPNAPVHPEYTFEGWLEYNESDGMVLVSHNIYSTAEVFDMPVPDYNVRFVAKWDGLDMDYYISLNNGSGGGGEQPNMEVHGDGGAFIVKTANEEWETEWHGVYLGAGKTLSDSGLIISDPVFWDPDRAFVGWMACTHEILTDEEGNTYEDNVQIEGTSIMTTAEMLKYPAREDGKTVIFIAQWEGDNADYYTDVMFDTHGGMLRVVEGDWQMETDFMGWGVRQDGTKISSQLGWQFDGDPVHDQYTFEGWLEYRDGQEGATLVSETLYTSAEILDKTVEADNMWFVAKWDGLDMDYYRNLFRGGGGGEDGEPSNVWVQGNEGEYTLVEPDGYVSQNVGGWGMNVPLGSSLAEEGYVVSDMEYWTPRAFKHWKLDIETPVYNENGDIDYWNWETREESLTTEQMLSYPIQEDGSNYNFIAVWEGDDSDYMASVEFQGRGADLIIQGPYETWTTDSYYTNLRKDGTKIGEQMFETTISAEGDPNWGDMEGWLSCEWLDGDVLLLLSETAYTMDQILDMVPTAPLIFVPKWSNVDLADYARLFGVRTSLYPEGTIVTDMVLDTPYEMTAGKTYGFNFTALSSGSYSLMTDAPQGIDTELCLQHISGGEWYISEAYPATTWLNTSGTLRLMVQPNVDCKLWVEEAPVVTKIELISQEEATYLKNDDLNYTAILEDTEMRLTLSNGQTEVVNGGEMWRYDWGYHDLPTTVELQNVTDSGAVLYLKCCEAEVRVPVAFDSASVVKMEVIPAADMFEFYENVNGFISENGEEGPFFYYTAADYAFSFATYRFTWSDGTVEDFQLDIQGQYGNFYHGVELWTDHAQWQEPWGVGEHTFNVWFGQMKDSLTVEIKPNPVESIKLLSLSPEQYTLGDPDYFSKSEDGWDLEWISFQKYQLEVTYKDGTTEILTEADETIYRDMIWLIDGKEAGGYAEQWHFTEPGKVMLNMTFMGLEAGYEVQIVEQAVVDGNVSVSDATVDKALENVEDGTVKLDAAATGEDVSSVKLPVTSVEKLAEEKVEQVVVELDSATVAMDTAALEAISQQAAGSTVTLSVEKVQEDTLTAAQQTALQGKQVDLVLTALVLSDGEPIGDFKGGSVTVSVPFTLPAGAKAEDYAVWYVAEDGTMTKMDTTYANGKLSFVTGHFSDYVVLKSEDAGLRGDMNGDGSVNDDDVILLLWYTLLPDMYSIQGNADFNADGSVNDEDVIYLLWHTLLPDMYPL